MTWSRPVSVLVLALGVGILAPTAASTAAAPATSHRAASSPAESSSAAAGRFDLTDDGVRQFARPGLAARVNKWRGKQIRYFESIPAKWDWSLDQAIAHWNSSGSKIKFVEVAKRRAQLKIGYGNTSGADGIATVGHQSVNYVHLSPTYKHADEFEPETRVWVGRLFTHELGHVLGFQHTRGQCSLMYPVYDFGACPPLPDDRPGYYNCRWIDKKLLRRFVSMYGGKAKRPPLLCLIEELPGQLTDVQFTGGQPVDEPVRITWRGPAKVRDGTKVRISVWKGSGCTSLPVTWELRVGVAPGANSWTDPGHGKGSWCYLLQIENRYGATRAPFGAARERWAPLPASPAVSQLAWRAADGGYRLTWHAPEGTDLVAMRNWDEPGTCLSTYDEDDAEYVDHVSGDTWQLSAVAPEECLTFFAVTEWDTVSAIGTQREVTAPKPPDPVLGPRTWDAQAGAFRFTWTEPDGYTWLRMMRNWDDPQQCLTTFDDDVADWPGDEGDGTLLLYPNAASECVVFFAQTSWGTVSGPVQVTTTVPPPTATPTVGTITPVPAQGYATVTASVPGGGQLGIEIRPGACPASAPGDAEFWDAYEDWENPGRYFLYPESDPADVHCAMFAAVDGYGRHGPVVLRPFSVGNP